MTFYYVIEKSTNKRAKIDDRHYLIVDDEIPENEVQRQGWLRMYNITEKMEISYWHERFDTVMEMK